jgi:hypothetical protein
MRCRAIAAAAAVLAGTAGLLCAQKSSTPDAFELFCEGILEAPRNPRPGVPPGYVPASRTPQSCSALSCPDSCAQTHSWWEFVLELAQLTPEEVRLQQFWRDYYEALKSYYQSPDQIDWVQYYKCGSGMQAVCPGQGCGRIQFAPVFVSPSMQWAVPNAPFPPGPPVIGPRQP